jgi:hypothetical protein
MSVARANENLAAQDRAPLPEGPLTPHSLRRAFISLLLAIGEDVPYVMGRVGHVDPKMTLSTYGQAMFRGEASASDCNRSFSQSNGHKWAQPPIWAISGLRRGSLTRAGNQR